MNKPENDHRKGTSDLERSDLDALPPLKEFWPYQAAVLGDLVSRHTMTIVRQYTDLNLSQWRVLAAVAEQPGRSSAEVVNVTPMDKGLVSRAVASLIDAQLIEKVNDASDRRKSSLYMTAQGEKNYSIIAAELAHAIRAIDQSMQGAGVNFEQFSSMLSFHIMKIEEAMK